MNGRLPKPITIIDNKVSKRTKEELTTRAEAEPNGCEDKLAVPSHLSADAKKEWRRVVRLYRQLDQKIINDLDKGVLACYCEAVALYAAAQKEMAKGQPLTVFNKDGVEKVNPLITIMDKQGANIARYSEQLCLSPVGRARMGVAALKKEVEADPLEKLLSQGRLG